MDHRYDAWLLLSLFVFCLVAPAASKETPSNDNAVTACNLTEEDYAVYSAVLSARGAPADPEDRWDNKPELIIGDTAAAGGGHFKEHKGGWPWGFRSHSKRKPAADTQRDFDAKINRSCAMKALLDYPPGYALISTKEVDEIFKKSQGGWIEFHKRYPQSSGIWTFSRVGYNVAKNEALVYLVHACGMLCGTGDLYLLAKENEKWVVKNRLLLWIS